MHRSIRDNLEEVLAEPARSGALQEHLHDCQECSGEINAMRAQAQLLRNLRADAEPRPGFYARVLERIEAQRQVSIWSLFGESAFGRRLAFASMALALLLGTYLVTTEQAEHRLANSTRQSALMWSQAEPDRADVLVNLVTYQEQ